MKHSWRVLLWPGLLLALLLAGCAAKPATSSDGSHRQASLPAMLAPTAAPAAAGATPAPEAIRDARKIILTTNLQLVVQDTDKTIAAIKGEVGAQGGYVAQANVWREENLLSAHLTVHVPADKLDAFVAVVKKYALRIEREESTGQDVTEEYVDLQAQLTNLEAAEKELRELLTSVREKTGKAEDIMAVYRELVNIRGQIDQLKGRQQYLDRMTAMATINLDLSERQPEPIDRPGWQPMQTLRRALSALVQAAKFGVDAAIWLVVFVVPLLVIPVLALWLIWLWSRRRAARRRQGADEGKPQLPGGAVPRAT